MDVEKITASLVLGYCSFVLSGCVKPEHKFTAMASFIGALVAAYFLYEALR